MSTPEAFEKFLAMWAATPVTDVLFINPHLVPVENFDHATARKKGYYAFPPIGLLYLAAAVKDLERVSDGAPSINVQVLDLNFELLRAAQNDSFEYDCWKNIVRSRVDALISPDSPLPVIGISNMFGTTSSIFKEIAQLLRTEYPQLLLTSGGVQSTYDFREILREGLSDIVFRKEGELQVQRLLACMNGRSNELPWGLAFKVDDTIYELPADSSTDVAWDRDISQFYDLIPTHEYSAIGSLSALSRFIGSEKPYATVLTSRGCRARCTFCTVRDFNGFGVRQRSVRSVVDEIKHLVREHGIQQIDWLDDDLLWNEKRAIELFRLLSEEVPNIEWSSSNGLIAVSLSDELMHWMTRSGLRAFKIGIESGNEEMLNRIKKPTTLGALREKRKLLAKYPQVFISPNFIIGFPGETFGQMLDTFNFACELQWDWASFFICQPLKGTEMFSAFCELGDERCAEETFSKTPNPGRSMIKGEFTSAGCATIARGHDIFNLPLDLVPDKDQLKEIWFAFNFNANFIRNVNFESDTRFGITPNSQKLVRWLEAIHDAYPHDASMAAALVKGYTILNDKPMAEYYRNRFDTILRNSPYWRTRVAEFPELLEMAQIEEAMELSNVIGRRK
jgi:hypothetical protein